MILKNKKENWGHYSTHCGSQCLFQAMPKKCGAGQEFALMPISLKIVSLSLSVLLTNCRSQLVSSLGREKLKSMLFYLTWIPSIFDSFDDHSSVHRSSGRLIPIHSFLEKKYHYGVVWFYGLNFRQCHIKKILLFKSIK